MERQILKKVRQKHASGHTTTHHPPGRSSCNIGRTTLGFGRLNLHDNSDQVNVVDGCRQQEDVEQESPWLFQGVAGGSCDVFDTAHANERSSFNIGRTTLGQYISDYKFSKVLGSNIDKEVSWNTGEFCLFTSFL